MRGSNIEGMGLEGVRMRGSNIEGMGLEELE